MNRGTPDLASLVGTWNVDPAHTGAHFSVRHMMVATVRGTFAQVGGRVELPAAGLTAATIEGEIDAASIDTRDEKRDAHLRSADFFDVENHPKMTFRSTKIEAKKDGTYAVGGDLTIRGTTKPVVFAVEAVQGPLKNPWGQTVVGATATTRIHRKDFGLTWNAALETGGVLVGDEVTIQLDVELTKG